MDFIAAAQFFCRRARLWKRLAKKLYMERVDICDYCGRECDPTTCWCGEDHRNSYGDGGHSHIPAGCVCGYAVNVERDHFVLKQMLLEAREEIQKLKTQPKEIFCSDPNCNTNNPRT